MATDQWSLFPRMLQETRDGDAGAVVGDHLYVIGGDDGELQYTESMQSFDFTYKASIEVFRIGELDDLQTLVRVDEGEDHS